MSLHAPSPELSKTNITAIASAVVAALSVVALMFVGPDAIFLSVIALFLGILAIRGVDNDRASTLSRTVAIFGTTVGGLAVGWYLIILLMVWYYF